MNFRKITVIFLPLFTFSCSAFEESNVTDINSKSVNVQHEQYMQNGKYLLEQNRTKEAKKQFELALDEELFESPNYESYLYLSKMYCVSGNKKKGKELLESFDCMQKVDSGQLSCFQNETGVSLIPNSNLGKQCFDVMCSEMFIGYYENPTKGQLDSIEKLSLIKSDIKSMCD